MKGLTDSFPAELSFFSLAEACVKFLCEKRISLRSFDAAYIVFEYILLYLKKVKKSSVLIHTASEKLRMTLLIEKNLNIYAKLDALSGEFVDCSSR